MFYAQINEQGYCGGILQLAGEVIQDNLIKIESFNTSYLGRKYDGENKTWTDEYCLPEESNLPYQLTSEELLQQQLTDIELHNLEAQQERQLIAQQISDLELSIIGGM